MQRYKSAIEEEDNIGECMRRKLQTYLASHTDVVRAMRHVRVDRAMLGLPLHSGLPVRVHLDHTYEGISLVPVEVAFVREAGCYLLPSPRVHLAARPKPPTPSLTPFCKLQGVVRNNDSQKTEWMYLSSCKSS